MSTLTNYYDELGIDRDADVSTIRVELKKLKQQWQKIAARPGSLHDKAKQQLQWIDEAEVAFTDNDSRDRYDIELRRTSVESTEADEPQIDWTARAWNYYYIGDNGAALVATRKAKEQNPTSPMPYVVASWVQIKDGEYRQAKTEADEAFVLDELTEDSVDVQKVRGTAYHFVEDYDRALVSYDKALTKATEYEAPDIYWRKSFSAEGKRDYQLAYDAAITGLSTGVVLDEQEQRALARQVANMSLQLDVLEPNTDDYSIMTKKLKTRLATIQEAPIDAGAKQLIASNLSTNITKTSRLADLEREINQLESIGEPGAQPSKPGCVPIGVMAVALFTALSMIFGGSVGSGSVFLLIALAVAYYVWTGLQKDKTWTAAKERFEAAQPKLEQKIKEYNSLQQAGLALMDL